MANARAIDVKGEEAVGIRRRVQKFEVCQQLTRAPRTVPNPVLAPASFQPQDEGRDNTVGDSEFPATTYFWNIGF